VNGENQVPAESLVGITAIWRSWGMGMIEVCFRQTEFVYVHWTKLTQSHVLYRTAMLTELTFGVPLRVKCLSGYTHTNVIVWYVCTYLVMLHNILSSRLLNKKVLNQIKIYETTYFLSFLWVWNLTCYPSIYYECFRTGCCGKYLCASEGK
jgi:hypothetical protein